MLFVSIYLRAWVVQMLELGATPRTLADDLMLMAYGSRALHIFKHAFTLTLQHLVDLGGKLSAHKSKLFSTIETHRVWLSADVWPIVHQQIDVVHNLRDLGAAINTMRHSCTSFSAQRLRSGIAAPYAIRRLPYAREIKGQIAIAKAHAMALYSCEATQIDQSMLRCFTSTLLGTVGTTNQLQARTLVFAFSGLPPEIDPYIYIFVRRVCSFRRFMVKHPEKETKVDLILQAYRRQQ